MTPDTYAVLAANVRQLAEHANSFDLNELAIAAEQFGTPADRRVIAALILFARSTAGGHR